MRYALLIVILVSTFHSAKAWPEPKAVLLVSSYHQEFPWTYQCEVGIRESVSAIANVETFYMDTKRLPDNEFQTRADLAWKKIEESNADLILLGDDNALRFLGPRLARKDTPVVFLGINHNPRVYFSDGLLPPNMTGVLERTPIFGTIRFISKIMPEAKRVLVITGDSQTSRAELKNTLLDQKTLATTGIVADVKVASNWADWLRTLHSAHETYDAIIPIAYFNIKDEHGKYLSAEEAITGMSETSQIPIFANQDYTVSDAGAMGALVIHGQTHGKRAGAIALKILEGTSPLAIAPEIDQSGVFYFNRKQLQRFDISLPEQIEKKVIFN
ncbi:ABC transporter substrate-binding protein [Hahella ganghwensis]|uniref:ABC transporter substrate-binding protein n=1 Tax=Hahella ganghwensis TaxID=286420 RepID=UPI00036A41D2|nr:ABC transporter substrate binding protein [Hahella ganghwensis]